MRKDCSVLCGAGRIQDGDWHFPVCRELPGMITQIQRSELCGAESTFSAYQI